MRLAEGIQAGDQLAVTDADGRFELAWSEDAPLLAMATGHGVAGFYVDGAHADPGEPWVIEMERSAWLEVRLEGVELDALSRLEFETPGYNLTRSLTGAMFSGPGRMFFSDEVWFVDVGGDGVARVELPARVPFAMRFGAATYPGDLTLEPGERREMVWRLNAGAAIDGQLVDDLGSPVARAEIWLCRSPLGQDSSLEEIYFYSSDGNDLGTKTRTDEEGRFAFEDIKPGEVWIGPAPLGRSPNESQRRGYSRTATRVVVPEGVERLGVKLVAHRGLVVAGQVVVPEGVERAYVRLTLTPDGGRGSLSVTAEADGAFLMGPLMPGAHTLRVSIMRSNLVVPEPITVFPGDEGLVIKPVRGGSIAGVVRDGETGAGLKASLWRSGGPDATIASAGSDEDGSFRIEGLAPGTYHLGVVTGEGRAGGLDDIEVGLGESVEGVEIALKRTGRVTVYYSGSTEYGNYYVRSGRAVVALDGLHDGTETTKEVPVGHLVVEMKTHDGQKERREIEVAEGEEVRVAFDLNGE